MKRYHVTGTQPVEGNPPGSTFDGTMPEEQERYLVGIGAIRVLDGNPRGKNKKTAAKKKSSG